MDIEKGSSRSTALITYLALAILHDQVSSKVLDEVVGVVSQRLAVEGVEKSVAGSVGSGTTSVGLTALSVFSRLTTERSLVAGGSGLAHYSCRLEVQRRSGAHILPSSVLEKGQP